jgi:hypothetical protein
LNDLPTLLARLEGGTRTPWEMVQQLPLLFFNRGQLAIHLDPASFTASPGSTVELTRSSNSH